MGRTDHMSRPGARKLFPASESGFLLRPRRAPCAQRRIRFDLPAFASRLPTPAPRQRGAAALAWLLAAQGGGLLSSFFFVAVAARKLPAEAFGQLAVWQAALAYGAVLADFAGAHVGVRHAARNGESIRVEALPRVVLEARIWPAIGAIVLATVLFQTAMAATQPVSWLWHAALAFTVLCGATSFEWWHLAHDARRVAVSRLGRHAALALGAAWLLCWPSAAVALSALAAGAMVATLLSLTARPPLAAAPRTEETRGYGREAWPLVVALLAQQWVWNGALLRAAKHAASDVFSGLAIGFRVYALGAALLAVYAAYLLPRSTRAAASAELLGWRRLALRRAGLGAAALLIGAPLAGWATPVVFGARYPLAPWAVAVYVLALIPLLWRVTSSNLLVALGRTGAYLALSLAGAASALLVAAMTGEAWWGPPAAAAAGEAVFALASAWVVRRALAGQMTRSDHQVRLPARLRKVWRQEGSRGVLRRLWLRPAGALREWWDGARWRVWRARGKQSAAVNGCVMHLNTQDPGISRELALYGTHEPLATERAAEFAQGARVILDIGANLGYYSLLFLKRVAPAPEIIAVEPSSVNVAVLEKNIAANGFERQVRVLRAAMSNYTGEGRLHLARQSNWHTLLAADARHSGEEAVPVFTIDALVEKLGLPRLDLLRMDIEGYEAVVAEGMMRTLERHRPRLIIELHPQLVGAAPILRLLNDLELRGYQAEHVIDRELDYAHLRHRAPPLDLRELLRTDLTQRCFTVFMSRLGPQHGRDATPY